MDNKNERNLYLMGHPNCVVSGTESSDTKTRSAPKPAPSEPDLGSKRAPRGFFNKLAFSATFALTAI